MAFEPKGWVADLFPDDEDDEEKGLPDLFKPSWPVTVDPQDAWLKGISEKPWFEIKRKPDIGEPGYKSDYEIMDEEWAQEQKKWKADLDRKRDDWIKSTHAPAKPLLNEGKLIVGERLKGKYGLNMRFGKSKRELYGSVIRQPGEYDRVGDDIWVARDAGISQHEWFSKVEETSGLHKEGAGLFWNGGNGVMGEVTHVERLPDHHPKYPGMDKVHFRWDEDTQVGKNAIWVTIDGDYSRGEVFKLGNGPQGWAGKDVRVRSSRSGGRHKIERMPDVGKAMNIFGETLDRPDYAEQATRAITKLNIPFIGSKIEDVGRGATTSLTAGTLELGAALIDVTTQGGMDEGVNNLRENAKKFRARYDPIDPDSMAHTLGHAGFDMAIDLTAAASTFGASMFLTAPARSYSEGFNDFLNTVEAGKVPKEFLDDYDTDGDGELTPAELKVAARKAGYLNLPTAVGEFFAQRILFSRVLGKPGGAGILKSRKYRSIAEDLLVSPLAEGTTELGQGMWTNAVASHFMGYDPDRDVTEGAWENFAVGAMMGMPFSAAGITRNYMNNQWLHHDIHDFRGAVAEDWTEADVNETFEAIDRTLTIQENGLKSFLNEAGGNFTNASGQMNAPAVHRDDALSVDEVKEAVAKQMQKQGANAPEVMVFDDVSQITHEGDRNAVDAALKAGAELSGLRSEASGTVYLHAPHLYSAEHAKRVFAHESIGHHGLEAVLGDKARAFYARVAKDYKGSKLWNEVRSENPSYDSETIAKEIVAKVSENPELYGKGMVTRFADFFRGYGKDKGVEVAEFTDNEILRGLTLGKRLVEARQAVKSRVDAGPKAMGYVDSLRATIAAYEAAPAPTEELEVQRIAAIAEMKTALEMADKALDFSKMEDGAKPYSITFSEETGKLTQIIRYKPDGTIVNVADMVDPADAHNAAEAMNRTFANAQAAGSQTSKNLEYQEPTAPTTAEALPGPYDASDYVDKPGVTEPYVSLKNFAGGFVDLYQRTPDGTSVDSIGETFSSQQEADARVTELNKLFIDQAAVLMSKEGEATAPAPTPEELPGPYDASDYYVGGGELPDNMRPYQVMEPYDDGTYGITQVAPDETQGELIGETFKSQQEADARAAELNKLYQNAVTRLMFPGWVGPEPTAATPVTPPTDPSGLPPPPTATTTIPPFPGVGVVPVQGDNPNDSPTSFVSRLTDLMRTKGASGNVFSDLDADFFASPKMLSIFNAWSAITDPDMDAFSMEHVQGVTDLKELAKAMGDRIEVKDSPSGYVLTDKRSLGSIRLRLEKGKIKINAMHAESDPDAEEKLTSGKVVYQLTMQWAHNNGLVVVADGGLTPVNTVRRPINSESSILANRSSAHIELAPYNEEKIIDSANWAGPNPTLNNGWQHDAVRLLLTNALKAHKAMPGLEKMSYDVSEGVFLNKYGEVAVYEDFLDVAKEAFPDGFANNKGIGLTTMKRAVITATVFNEGFTKAAVEKGLAKEGRKTTSKILASGKGVEVDPDLQEIQYRWDEDSFRWQYAERKSSFDVPPRWEFNNDILEKLERLKPKNAFDALKVLADTQPLPGFDGLFTGTEAMLISMAQTLVNNQGAALKKLDYKQIDDVDAGYSGRYIAKGRDRTKFSRGRIEVNVARGLVDLNISKTLLHEAIHGAFDAALGPMFDRGDIFKEILRDQLRDHGYDPRSVDRGQRPGGLSSTQESQLLAEVTGKRYLAKLKQRADALPKDHPGKKLVATYLKAFDALGEGLEGVEGFYDVMTLFDDMGRPERIPPHAQKKHFKKQRARVEDWHLGMEKMPQGQGAYDFFTLEEFIAHAFSQNNFQKLLAQLPPLEGSKAKSLWADWIDSIFEYIGFKNKSDESLGLLSDVLDAGASVLRDDKPLEWNPKTQLAREKGRIQFSGKGVPMDSPTRESKFTQQVVEDALIENVVKAGLNRTYDVVENKTVFNEALKVVWKQNEQGGFDYREEAATRVMDSSNEMPDDVRVAAGFMIMRRHNTMISVAERAGDVDAQNAHAEASWVMANHLSEFGRNAGRVVQMYKNYSMLHPYTLLYKSKHVIERVARRGVEKSGMGEEAEQIIEVLTTARNIAAENALQQQSVKGLVEAINELFEKKGKPIWGRYKKNAATRILGAITRAKKDPRKQAPIEEFTNMLVSEAKARLEAEGVAVTPPKNKAEAKRRDADLLADLFKNSEQYGEVWEVVGEKLDAADPETANAVKKIFGEIQRDPASNKIVTGVVRDTLADMNEALPQLVREHYTKKDATAEKLQASILKGLSERGVQLTDEQAKHLSRRIDTQYRQILKKFADAEINRILEASKKKGSKRLKKTGTDRLIELANIGALDDEQVYNAVAQGLGLPSYDKAWVNKMKKLADKVAEAPEGSPKIEATLNLTNEISDRVGERFSDLLFAARFSNMLSGFSTQQINFMSSLENLTFGQFGLLMRLRSVKGSFYLGASLLRGLKTGFREGWKILATGRGRKGVATTRYRQDPVMERWKPKGWKKAFIPGQFFWKSVTRFMSATDALMRFAGAESKAYVLAHEAAKKKKLKGKAFWDHVTGVLALEAPTQEQALEQAKQEGFTGPLESLRRRDEIIQMQRDPELQTFADEFGSLQTFQQNPRGALGRLAKWLNELSNPRIKPGELPKEGMMPVAWGAKFFVPFINTLANVGNVMIDYNPALGYLSNAGRRLGSKRGWVQEISKEDLSDQMYRTHVGTLAAMTLYALLEAEFEEDEPRFELYGRGPLDKKARAELLAAKQFEPNTLVIRMFGKTIRINTLETPIGLTCGFLANSIYDRRRYNDMDEESMMKRATVGALYSFEQWKEMSFLNSIDTLAEVAAAGSSGDVDEAWEKLQDVLSFGASSFVTPNLIRQVDRALDPTKTSINDLNSWYQQMVPFARRKGYADLDMFGQNIQTQGGTLSQRIWHRIARPDLPKHPAIDLMVKNDWFPPSIAKNSMVKRGQIWRSDKKYHEIEPAKPLEHYAWQKISGHEMERLLLRDLDAMSAMDAEDYQKHAKALWSEAREVGKLTIASATDEDLEKISRMRIPRARGDKILPPVGKIRVTSSDKAKAKVKRMIKWLSSE